MDTGNSPDPEQIATTCISYYCWAAAQPPDESGARRTLSEGAEEHAKAAAHGFWAHEAVDLLVRTEPEKAWSMSCDSLNCALTTTCWRASLPARWRTYSACTPTPSSIVSRLTRRRIRSSDAVSRACGVGRPFQKTYRSECDAPGKVKTRSSRDDRTDLASPTGPPDKGGAADGHIPSRGGIARGLKGRAIPC